jgi:hypothetical protein
LDVSPPDDFNSAAATSWFSKATGGGTSAVSKQVRFYQLLCERDPSGAQNVKKSATESSNGHPTKGKSRVKAHSSTPTKRSRQGENDHAQYLGTASTVENHRLVTQSSESGNNSGGSYPSLHVDIQIHISSDASTAQIDAIFSSMAKHLYSNNNIPSDVKE